MQASNSSVFKSRRARQKLFQCAAYAQQLGALQGTSGLAPQQVVDRNNATGAPVAKAFAVALGAYVLSPVASAVAAQEAVFARNPVAYCSINLINCLAATDAVGAAAAGVPGTGAPIPHVSMTGVPQTGSTVPVGGVEKLVSSAVADAEIVESN